MIGTCVVNASVGIKLFLVEDLSEQASRLFSQLATDSLIYLYVPDLY